MVPDQTTLTKRRTAPRRLVHLVAVALVAVSLGVQSSSAAEDPRFPGLPEVNGKWVGPRSTGVNFVGRAEQWMRLPPMIIAAYAPLAQSKTDTSCRRYFPFKSVIDYPATGYFRSSKGAAEPWGIVGPFTVRTAAFGSIPVEASITIRQPRDSSNLPVGLAIHQRGSTYCDAEQPYPTNPELGGGNSRVGAATAKGQVEVVVTSLKVDGVDLGLAGGSCRTSRLGTLDLSSVAFDTQQPDQLLPGVEPIPENILTTPYLTLANGGLLTGTVDIPAFSGCATKSGDDVSRLLTAAVSGADNNVRVRTEGLQETECMVPDPPMGPGERCEPLPELTLPPTD